MAKLKFDRSINLILESGDGVNVPQDEVWRVFAFGTTGLGINGAVIHSSSTAGFPPILMLGGVLKSLEVALFQGLHLRLYNKLAKEVSLA